MDTLLRRPQSPSPPCRGHSAEVFSMLPGYHTRPSARAQSLDWWCKPRGKWLRGIQEVHGMFLKFSVKSNPILKLKTTTKDSHHRARLSISCSPFYSVIPWLVLLITSPVVPWSPPPAPRHWDTPSTYPHPLDWDAASG